MGMSHHNNVHKAAHRKNDKHTPMSTVPSGAPVAKIVKTKSNGPQTAKMTRMGVFANDTNRPVSG